MPDHTQASDAEPHEPEATDPAQRDRAERAIAAALITQSNAARVATYERDQTRHSARRRWLVLVTAVVGGYELLWWTAALRARNDALAASDIEVLLSHLRSWTTVAAAHWILTVAACVTLAVLWRRHLRRRPVLPLLERALDDEARRHPSFGPDATARRRIV